MGRIRRGRWIAIIAAIIAMVATLAVGASAFANQGAARCVPPPPAAAVSGQNSSAHNHAWRSGAFKVAGCRAWRHMHRRQQVLSRTAPR